MSTFMWAVSTTGVEALQQMNPYTSQMQRVVSDGNTITFKYVLNGNAESIDILVDFNEDTEFKDDEVVYKITDPTKLKRESLNELPVLHEVSIPFAVFREMADHAGEYQWAMRTNRAEYAVPTHAYPNNWGRMVYNMPKGLAVDNNPESDYFGNIYTTESKNCTSADGVGNTLAGGNKTNYAKGEGVYAYYPSLDQYEYPTNHTCYKGGVDWTGSSTTSDEYAPFRLAVAPDGMVFVNDNRKEGDGVTASLYRINPANLNTNLNFGQILSPRDLSKCSVDGHPRAMSMAIMKNGNKQELYVLNAYRRSSTNGSYSYHPHLHRWTLNGTSVESHKEWVVCKNVTDNKESKIVYNGKSYEIVNQTTTIVPGIYNDLWIAQRRVSPDANPCLMHLKIDANDNLICDFIIVVNAAGKESINKDLLKINGEGACPKAALALSVDGSMLALGSNGYINVLDITYDPTTKTPTLKRNDTKTIQLSTTKGAAVICNALTFDRANNLYAMSETTHQFYIYAMPGQASTIIPAKKSMTINIAEAICWHPYPDGYALSNAELLEMFKHDYKARYGRDCDFNSNTYSDNFMDMLTNEKSPWKWLGDYFLGIGVERRDIPTNAALWGSDNDSKYPTNGIKKEFNTWCGNNISDFSNRSNMAIGNAATFFASSSNTYKFFTQNSKYKWLGDYIKKVAKEQGKTLSSSYGYWHWVAHAFFNRNENSSTTTAGNSYTHGLDFSSAGKPTEWRAAYLAAMSAQGVTVGKVNDALDLASEWRVCAGTFFDQLPTETSQGFVTTKIYNKRDHEHWYSYWLSSLPNTAEVKERNALPYVVRNGRIFGGWYYGNKCTSDDPGYDITSPPVTVANIANNCVYARWLEPVLREGHVTDMQMIARWRKVYTNFNLDLINTINASGQGYDLQIDRKLQGGMYNTMCLPFAIDGKTEFANIQYADGSGQPFKDVNDFSLVYYAGSEYVEDALILNFRELGDADELDANTPFLIKPNNDIIKLMQYGTVKSIALVDCNSAPVQAIDDDDDEGEGGAIIPQTHAEYTCPVDDQSITFTGVLAPVNVSENSVLLVANNRLAVSSSSGEMLGMRGFFSFKAQPIQQPMAIKITSKEGTTTYLDAVDMTTETQTATKILHNGQIYILRGNEVYTITGNRVK